MLGCVEYSAEYIRLWNLVRRCEGCRKFRELAERRLKSALQLREASLKSGEGKLEMQSHALRTATGSQLRRR